jgi:hypothetical protein
MSLSTLAPSISRPPRDLSLRDEFAPDATPEEWAEACREAFAELSGLEPLPWSTARCCAVLRQAGGRVVDRFMARSGFRIYNPSARAIHRVTETSAAALVASALGQGPEAWCDLDEPVVLLGHCRHVSEHQARILLRLANLGLTVSIDQGANWGGEAAPLQVRLWARGEALPIPTTGERLATRRMLGL